MALGLGAAPFSATGMVVELDHGHVRGDVTADELAIGIDSATSSYRWKVGAISALSYAGPWATSAGRVRIASGDIVIADKHLAQLDLDDVELADLSVAEGNTRLWCEKLTCKSLRFDGRNLEVEGLRLAGVRLEQTMEGGDGSADAGTDQEQASGGGSSFMPVSYDFLDRLHGRLDANVALEYRAKVVGRRRAVHKFHLPISDGTIDYRRLESGLSRLENMVIDIEFEGDRLIVEKDVPLLPFDGTELLVWPLPEEEREMAKSGRVRLARLLEFKVPDKPERKRKKKDKKPSFTFLGVELESLAATLTMLSGSFVQLAGGGRVSLGTDEHPAFRDLELGGELTYHREKPAPSKLQAACGELNLGVADLRAGKLALEQIRLRGGELALSLELDEKLRPARLTAELGSLGIGELTAVLAAGSE